MPCLPPWSMRCDGEFDQSSSSFKSKLWISFYLLSLIVGGNVSIKRCKNIKFSPTESLFWSVFHLDQLSSLTTRAMSLSPSLLAIQDDEVDEDDRASLASSLQSQFGTPLFGLSPSEEVSLLQTL